MIVHFIDIGGFIDRQLSLRGYSGRDGMVVGFTTTYAISAYHH